VFEPSNFARRRTSQEPVDNLLCELSANRAEADGLHSRRTGAHPG
jgi:hypothetical protein